MDVKGNLDNNVASRNYRSAEAPDAYVYVFSRELGYLPSIDQASHIAESESEPPYWSLVTATEMAWQ
jgi:hypothetical protein